MISFLLRRGWGPQPPPESSETERVGPVVSATEEEPALQIPSWHIAYRHHLLMNPLSEQKVSQLGTLVSLSPTDHIVDVGAGTGGPGVLLAREYGCRVTAIEHHGPFVQRMKQRADEYDVADLIETIESDAKAVQLERGAYSLALCLGASFALGSYETCAQTLARAVQPGGHVAIGDGYIEPGAANDPRSIYTLEAQIDYLLSAGLVPVALITASRDDWNRYHSLQVLSIEDWIEEPPDHPDTAERRADRQRRLHNLAAPPPPWAVLVGRRTD